MHVTRSIRLTALLTALLFVGAVGASAKTQHCTVPKLSGLTLKTAEKRVHAASCKVGKIHRPTAHGTLLVKRQTPKAHAKMKHGAKVTLWVKAKPVKAKPVSVTKQPTITTASATSTTTTPTVSTPAPTTSTPAPTTTTTPQAVRASIDPSYTQDNTDPLKVTWAYDAGTDDGTLPLGVLSLTVYQHGHVSSAGGCTIDVGGAITGGNCTQTLPSYGSYDVTVTYTSSSATVASSTETDTEDIEPPTPEPVTNTYTWGTDDPTQGVSVDTLLVGDTATVTVGDPNFEGADHVDLTDSTGGQCTATVSGITATCTITDIATPTAYTISYPGGPTQTTTQTVSPFGVPQQQTVNSEWPATVVEINNPQVTIQQAFLVECGGQAPSADWGSGSNFGCTDANTPKTWHSTVTIAANTSVFLDAWAYGTLQDDSNPTGTVNYNVSGGTEGTDYDVESTPCGPQCGYEQLFFVTPGTYTVSTDFTSDDPNYVDQPDGPSINVTVVP